MTDQDSGGRVLGWLLLALPFLGAALATQTYRHPEEGGMVVLLAVALLPVLTALLMVVDGRRRGSVGWGFAVLTCAFWILFYPLFLRIRDKTEGTKHHLPIGLVGMALLGLAAYYGNSIHYDTEAQCSWQGRDVACVFHNRSWWIARGGALVTIAQKEGTRTQDVGVYSYRSIGPFGQRRVTATETMGSLGHAFEPLLRELCGDGPDPGQRCTLSWGPLPVL